MTDFSKAIAMLLDLEIKNNAMLHVILGSIAKDEVNKERLLAEVERQKESIKKTLFPTDAHQV